MSEAAPEENSGPYSKNKAKEVEGVAQVIG
jgi:hypothetical protein